MKRTMLSLLLAFVVLVLAVPATAQESAARDPAVANPGYDLSGSPIAKPVPAPPFAASLLLVESDWSKVPAAKEIEAELRKALEGVPVPQELLERLPASGAQILFPPEIISHYSAKHAAELVAWLNAKGLLDEKHITPFPDSQESTNDPLPPAQSTLLAQPFELLDLPPLSHEPTETFVSKKSEFYWSIVFAGNDHPFQIRRALGVTRHFRGQGGNFLPYDESSFDFPVPNGQVAFVQAFPSGSEERFREAARRQGHEVLLTVEPTNKPGWGVSVEPRLHLPEKVSPIVVKRARVHRWPDEPTTTAMGSSSGNPPAQADEPPEEVVVVRLKQADPFVVEPTLNKLFAGEVKIIAQSRGGLGKELIVRGPRKSVEQVTELLKLIDQPMPAGDQGGYGSGDGAEYDPTGGEDGYSAGSAKRASPAVPASRDQLREQFDSLEKRAAELARALREKQGSSPAEGKQNDELRKVVAQAFSARQRLHQAELAALEARLKGMRETLAMRERIKHAIIDRRVEDLLNPELDWNASAVTTSRDTGQGADLAAIREDEAQPLNRNALPRLPVQITVEGPIGTTGIWHGSELRFELPTNLSLAYGGKSPFTLTSIPTRAGLTLSGMLEIADIQPETRPFLEHNVISLAFAVEDIDQAAAGNQVTKVVYRPKATEGETEAEAAPETLVSTRLDPGVDPLAEANRRGYVLAVLTLTSAEPPPEATAADPGQASSPNRQRDGTLILHQPEEIQKRLSELSGLVDHWQDQIAARKKEVAAGRQEQSLVDMAERQLRSWQNKLDLALAQHAAQLKLLESNLQEAQGAQETADRDLDRVEALYAENAASAAEFDKHILQTQSAGRQVERAKTLLELYQSIRYDAAPGESGTTEPFRRH